MTSALEPTLHDVCLTLCSLCLDGAGGECHTPGCALWLNRAPDLSLRDSWLVRSIDGIGWNADYTERDRPLSDEDTAVSPEQGDR